MHERQLPSALNSECSQSGVQWGTESLVTQTAERLLLRTVVETWRWISYFLDPLE